MKKRAKHGLKFKARKPKQKKELTDAEKAAERQKQKEEDFKREIAEFDKEADCGVGIDSETL